MALTKSGILASDFAEILEEHFRYREFEREAASATSPDAFKRRVYDILHGKCHMVSLRVVDEISTACGRPDWLALLT